MDLGPFYIHILISSTIYGQVLKKLCLKNAIFSIFGKNAHIHYF